MAYATNMAAMNAARKQFGQGWKDQAMIEKLDGQWHVQLKQIEPRDHSACLVSEREGAFAFPMAADMPADQPEAAAHDLTDAAMAQQQAAADAIANRAILSGFTADGKCPKCGSSEVFSGYTEKGLVIDDERVGGCHECDYEFDRRVSGKTWVRKSTIEKPTKRVWHIADEMHAAAREAGKPAPSRKEVQDECVRRGIASGTARTQYQAWKKATDEAAANSLRAAELSKKFNS